MAHDDEHEPCPECGTELDGGPIPEAYREGYAPPFRWTLAVLHIVAGRDDSWYQCPKCQVTLDKVDPGSSGGGFRKCAVVMHPPQGAAP